MPFLLLFLCFFTLSFAVEESSLVHFKGVLKDSLFVDDLCTVELLETGEIQEVRWGDPFEMILPKDTLWNLCVYASKKEKCFELLYLGEESVFAAEITDNLMVTHYDDDSVEEIPEPIFELQENTDLDIEDFLESKLESHTELKKVLVQIRRKPKRTLGSSVVSAKSIKRMPGLAEADVIRSIQALPGVVASSDFSTKIYVRGGAADQNLFLLDNAVVYSPTHFFGLFSTFLVEAIDDVKFYKSGFPAPYGNRLSSVLDMQSRKASSEKEEYFAKSSVKVSTFAAQVHTEGHRGKAFWVLAGRSTYIGPMISLFNKIGLMDLDLDYKFTDLQSSFVYQFSDDMEFKWSTYWGGDHLVFDPLDVAWGNRVIPLNFRWRFSENLEYNNTVFFSHFYQTMDLLDLLSLGNDIKSFAVKQWLHNYKHAGHVFTYGLEVEYNEVDFWTHMFDTKIKDTQKWFHWVAYLTDAYQVNPKFSMQYGVRSNYQSLSKHWGFEPRLSLAYELSPKQKIEFYAGRYFQYLNSVMFSDQESLNEFYYPSVTTSRGKQLKPASSFLFAVGFHQKKIGEYWEASVEGYYKTQKHLNTFKTETDKENEEEKDFLLADYFGNAEAYSMGYELSLQKNQGVFLMGLSFSQALSVLRNNDDSTVYFPNWHQPYALKLDLGLNWKGDEESIWKHKKAGRYLRSSLVLKYASGMPLTQKIGYYEVDNLGVSRNANDIVVVSGKRNGGKQSDYFRLDLKVIDMGRENKWNFSWTIINLTGHENMFYAYYDTSQNPPIYNTIPQFPFLPIMLNYEYYF